MKRFATLLLIMACLCLLAGVLLQILRFDPQVIMEYLGALGLYGVTAESFVRAISPSLLVTGLLLLLLATIFLLYERNCVEPFRWSERKFLLFIIGLQFTIGLATVSLTPYNIKVGGDEAWYFCQAKNLAAGIDPAWNYVTHDSEGGEPTAFYPIGYAAFLSLFFIIFGAKVWLAQALNLLIFAGITLFTYLLSKEFFGQRMARQAALVIALTPSQIFFTIPILSDPLFALLVVVLLYLAHKKASTANTLLMGILLGFATLTRSVSFLFPIALAIYRITRDRKWKPALLQVIAMGIICCSILLPWQIRNYKVFKQFVPFDTHGGWLFWMGNNPHATGTAHGFDVVPLDVDIFSPKRETNEAQRDQILFQRGISWALSHPIKAVSIWPKKIFFLFYRDSKCVSWSIRSSYEAIPPPIIGAMYLVTDGYYYALGLSFLISIIILIKKERISPRVWLTAGTILYFTLIYLPFLTESRYHLPLMPLFVIVAVLKHSSISWADVNKKVDS